MDHEHHNHSTHSHENHDHSGHHNHSGGHHNHHDHHAHMIEDFKRRFWISIGLMIPIMILSPMIQNLIGFNVSFSGDRYILLGLSTVIYFFGGWPFLKGLYSEISKGKPGMMTLIALAISVAFLYSAAVVLGLNGKTFFWELASLIALMLLGHWIEMKSVMGASSALQEIANLIPSEAHKIIDGETKDVPVKELKKGDKILIRPGENIPIDGVITKGTAHINESMITGESKPVEKKKGDEVIGRSINNHGSLTIEVSHISDESYLSKVINMVSEAQQSHSKTQHLADKAAGWLFYLALSAGIITLVVWLSLGEGLEFSLERMVTVMVISCPHALGLAIPLVVSISTSLSAKNGFVIRNRSSFENARKITTVIFDKTGTLTKGEFGVSTFKSTSENYSDEEMLQLAASIEHFSEHPIAEGIVRKCRELNKEFLDIKNFDSITGKGVKGEFEGRTIEILSPSAVRSQNLELPHNIKEEVDETVVFLIENGDFIGYISLSDEIRESAVDTIKQLHEKGIHVVMATGDNKSVAKAVGERIGIDTIHAELLPDDKLALVKELQAKGEFVAMTGDGINDAPALAQADVGIAIGSGTDVAAETADIILANSDPKSVNQIIEFGTATYRKMMQNLWWAAGYNIISVPLAAGILSGIGIMISPAVGAILMSLSTIIVALNAQLLRKNLNN